MAEASTTNTNVGLSNATFNIQSQNADGSWGFYGQPTAEETAYGLLALAADNHINTRDRMR